MAIAFNAGSHGTVLANTTLTFAHDCGDGSDRVVVVMAFIERTNDPAPTATYGGISMGAPRHSNSGQVPNRVYVWCLANPPEGSNNVVITANAAINMGAAAVSFTGVDQTTPVADAQSNDNAFPPTPFSTSITTPSGGVAVDFFYKLENTTTAAPDPSQNLAAGPVTFGSFTFGSSYKPDATSMAWTHTGSGTVPAVIAALALSPATSGGDGVEGSGDTTIGDFTSEGEGEGEAVSAGTITTAPLKNNTGTVWANETGATVYIYDPDTGELVVSLTEQTTDASGVMTITDPLIVGGTEYRVVIVLSSGAEGMDRITAT